MQEIETTPTVEDQNERGFPPGGFPHDEFNAWLDAHEQPITAEEEAAAYLAYCRSASGRFMVDESTDRPGSFYVLDFATGEVVAEGDTLRGAIGKRDELEQEAVRSPAA